MFSQVCVCPTFGGWGTPIHQWGHPILPDWGGGGTSIQSQWGYPIPLDGGYPHQDRVRELPHWDWMGVPLSELDRSSPPPRIRTRCGTPLLGLDGCTPSPSQDWMGVPPSQNWMGYHPAGTGWGHPPVRTGWGYPPLPPPHQETEQLCSRRYAPCVHAGGLSCFFQFTT